MVGIEVSSSYWRYNDFRVTIMCAGYGADSEQLYVTSVQSAEGDDRVTLEADAADHIELIVYFIPESLPGGKNHPIEEYPPFEAQICVTSGKKIIHDALHSINAWGGSVKKMSLKL